MKARYSSILVFSLGLFLLALPTQAQQKIGYVDLKKLFDGYWKTKQADAALKDDASRYDREKKQMLEDFQKGQDDYKKLLESANDQAVSSEEREKRKKSAEAKLLELREVDQSIRTFDNTARATLAEKQKTKRDKILEEINAIVTSVARSGGYAIVLDIASETINGTKTVLFVDGKDDLTDKVLEQLKATEPVPLPGDPAAPKK